MLCRLATLVVVLVLIAGAVPAHANSRYGAVVMDYATGEILHSRRADVPLFPASLTKMMTLMMLFDALERGDLRLDSTLPVSRRAADMPASKLGLKAGSSITVDQAIRAMTVRSANDVAVVIAEALAASEARFSELMTERAKALGMRNTVFKNASGLPNSRQRSTARDMAILANRLIRHYPQYYHYFSEDRFRFGGRTYRSHNRLVGSYTGMDGLKTGYTRASGFNLASSAVRNGQRVIVVVFGGRSARSRDDEVVRLMDLGFARLPDRPAEPLLAVLPRPKPVSANAATRATSPSPEIAAVSGDAPILPEARPSSADFSSEIAQTATVTPAALISASVLDVLPAAERAMFDDAAAATVLPPANPKPGELVSGLVTGAAKSPTRGSFAVQVGAYHDPNLARRIAHRATELVPQLLLLGDIEISPLPGRQQTVYRARIGGFERSVAERACGLLQAKRHDCFVIQSAPVRADGTS